MKSSYGDLKDINIYDSNIYDSNKKKSLTKLSFVGTLLIAISGFIFLYIAYMDEDIDVELAFN